MKRKLFKSELRDEAFDDEAVMRSIFPECFPDQRDEEITKLRAEVERLTIFETVLSQNGEITAQTINNLRAELANAEAWRRENNDLIIELNAELAEAKKAMEFNFDQYQDAARLLCEECEKNEALKKDADRYRWLLQHGEANSKKSTRARIYRDELRRMVLVDFAYWCSAEDVSTAIDEAIYEYKTREQQPCTTNE